MKIYIRYQLESACIANVGHLVYRHLWHPYESIIKLPAWSGYPWDFETNLTVLEHWPTNHTPKFNSIDHFVGAFQGVISQI